MPVPGSRIRSLSLPQVSDPVLQRALAQLLAAFNQQAKETGALLGRDYHLDLMDEMPPYTAPDATTDFQLSTLRAASGTNPALMAPVPKSSSARGTRGQICLDKDFLYVCVSGDFKAGEAGVWRRVALSSF